MRKIKLFANYALRELLPSELQQVLPERTTGTKQNTMLLSFLTEGERDHFASVCRRFQFSFRYVQ